MIHAASATRLGGEGGGVLVASLCGVSGERQGRQEGVMGTGVIGRWVGRGMGRVGRVGLSLVSPSFSRFPLVTLVTLVTLPFSGLRS